MNLYEMTETAKYLYLMLEDGEIDEQVVSDSIESMCVSDKLEDYCKVIQQFKADAKAYEAEKNRLKKKQEQAERAVERLSKAVINFMAVTGEEKKKCGLFDLRVNSGKSVQVVDVDKIPEQFFKEQPAKLDVAGIRKILMDGGEVAGAALQIEPYITIR